MTPAINAAGSSLNLVAIRVKNLERSELIPRCGRAHLIECPLFDREADLKCAIVTPKPHAAVLAVIARVGFGKLSAMSSYPSCRNGLDSNAAYFGFVAVTDDGASLSKPADAAVSIGSRSKAAL